MESIENKALEMSEEQLEGVAGGRDAKKKVAAGGLAKRPDDKPGYIIHQISATDNLTRIAKKYNTTVSEIMACNSSIKDKNLIRTGFFIYVPAR